MTEGEKLARRKKFAEWEGYSDFRQSHVTLEWMALKDGSVPARDGGTSRHDLLPNYDNDATALLRLMERALLYGYSILFHCCCLPPCCVDVGRYKGKADTHAEAFLAALYAAIQGGKG